MEKSMFSFFEVEDKATSKNTIHLLDDDDDDDDDDQTRVSKTSHQATKSDKNDVDSSLTREDLLEDYKQATKSDKNDVDSSLTREDLLEDYKQATKRDKNDVDSSLTREDLLEDYKQDGLVSSAKAEVGQVREENHKLKQKLSRVLNDYKSLQMHFNDFFQQEVHKSSECLAPDQGDGTELFSLSLGTLSSFKPKTVGQKKVNCFSKRIEDSDDDEELKLGLGCEFDPTPNRVDFNDAKKDERMQIMEPPVDSLKTERSEDSDLLDQIPLKKARVSVKVVCDTQTMNDGCQWRKYGQKIAKGNPCPRAYYRCTVSPSCPVRKHVQRCAEDRSVLITTYEGTHNHPLSVSATAMASATSAAASMLKSTSSTSQPGLTTSAAFTTTTFANHHGMTHNSRAPQYPFYLPNTTISTYQSHPTVTLDLTSNPLFTRSNSSNFLMSAPRFSTSTCLNFSSPSSSSFPSIESSYKNPIPFSYLGRQTSLHENFKNNNSTSGSLHHSADTIEAATKALTSNPSFRSALAASITSLVRNVGNGARI